ncbi:MAG: alpha/beta fold hydrolase [Piscinibacter sp.]|uniref:alpha/beta fold hydrolase n=1 Tax=Piscinibacter sp. TaxID=1903157 RepID=UPI00258E3807|nr:alpha/beta fold hydrolase [Piscinibacter sp.]MCW5664958.1 alpha/beta fold hydrolase [Piscinibacter sp.]
MRRRTASWLIGLAALSAQQAHAGPAAPCRLPGLAHEALCGSLPRALDPARPDGPRIEVHYAVVPALARRKLGDPVFLLAGGPGQSAIGVAPALMGLFARLNQRRDIVFVDQRGTGRSAPLACDDADDMPLSEQADVEATLRRLAGCRARLQALPHGRDGGLAFFTTVLASQDLDAVRRALGAEHINLVGISYGTRVALDYQRQFPQAVRRSVLDGVAPPDMGLPASAAADAQAALDALLDACAAELPCRTAWPDLRGDWQRLLAALPRELSLADPRSGRPGRVTLTREALLGAVRGPLYAPALAAGLPAAIGAAAGGRFEPLAALAGVLAPRGATQVYGGMHFSVVCAEDLPPRAAGAEPPARDFGRGLLPLYERACADWPRAAVPEAFYRLPPAASPVLMFSGGLDPATPPRHARRVAAALGPQARSLVVGHAGHGVLGIGCAPDLLTRFIDSAEDAAALALDAACLAAIPRPPAFVPEGLR